MTSLAAEIVRRIVKDLQNRKGIGDEWDQIDRAVQKEIKEKWAEIVDEVVMET